MKINLMKNHKQCPAVWYTHYLLNRPVKTFEYRWFPFKSTRAIKIFAKTMAMIHDHILCHEMDYGIRYGIINYKK